MLAPYADEIREDLNIMGQIDLVFAKAKLSRFVPLAQIGLLF